MSGSAMPPGRTPELVVRRFDSGEALDAALAERLAAACSRAAPPARAALVLSGGRTPLAAYRRAAAARLAPSPHLHILYSDERHVPSDSESSNFHASRPLIDALALPPERVLRVRTELPLGEAADDYDARLGALAARGVGVGLALFGLGADGHTASLFSREDLTRAAGRRAIAVHRPDGRDAVSVTPAFIATAAEPLLVATGREKRDVLAALLAGADELVAAQAFAQCRRIEVWTDGGAYPQERDQP